MPFIVHLGFVVRHDARETKNIVAACVAQLSDQGKTIWRAYPLGERAFVRMLFVTSVLVKQRFARLADPESGISQGEILLKKPNPRFDFILNYLFDVSTKPSRYKSLPQDLRQAMKFFFHIYGQKNTTQLQAPKDGLRSSQIFFWTVSDYVKQTDKQLPKSPMTVKVSESSPRSNAHIALHIPELAEKVRLHLAQPESWKNLYRKALKAPEGLPAHKIALYGSRIEQQRRKEKKRQRDATYSEKHLQFSDMLTRHSRILLTGPSGSGKTTILKMHIMDLLNSKPSMRGILPIFVSLKYVGFNGKSVTDLIVDSVVQQILNAKSFKRIMRQQIDIRRAQYGDPFDHSLSINSETKQNQLAESLLTTEVRDFFKSKELKGGNGIGLFLDGYNEVSEIKQSESDTEIKLLLRNAEKVVVSARSFGAEQLLPQLKRYELEKLSDQQIIQYLNLCIDGKGEEVFHHDIATNGRLLSMARNPLYLSLITGRMKEDPNVMIPNNRALLIQDFVQKTVQRKREEAINLSGHVKDSLLFVVLPSVAKWSLDSLTQTETSGLKPFHLSKHFQDIQDSSIRVFEALQLAEKYGLLTSSGLPAAYYESREYPEFIHDNIRDYFAALYFKCLDESEFLQTLPERLEYFVWDEPLLQFLELGVNEEMVCNVVDLILPRDLVLASFSVMYAEGIGHDLVLELERKIRESKDYEAGTKRPECKRVAITPRRLHPCQDLRTSPTTQSIA